MLPLSVILSVGGIKDSIIEYSACQYAILNTQRKIGILSFQIDHIWRHFKATVKISEPEFESTLCHIGGQAEVLL